MTVPAPTLSLKICFGGNEVEVDADISKKIRDIIQSALTKHGLDQEDPDDAHLSDPVGRLYYPDEDIADANLGNGFLLSLTIPF